MLVGKGGKIRHPLTAYSLSNISTQNCKNRLIQPTSELKRATSTGGSSPSEVYRTRSTAIGYGSRAPTGYVLQCFVRLPNYEHFGLQGLHVANGGRPLTPSYGRLGTNPYIRPSPLIPPPRGGRPRAAWVDCSSNHTPLEWSLAFTLVNQFPGKAHRPRKGMENPPHYGHVLP